MNEWFICHTHIKDYINYENINKVARRPQDFTKILHMFKRDLFIVRNDHAYEWPQKWSSTNEI
jgi:hypothetical protein